MPRKHLIASGINKKQQSQAKVWNKLAKEIKAAAKVGGPNPDANPRLKAAIDKALQNNLSRESIQKNINGAEKDKDALTDYLYEIYGPKGLAIIVQGLSDNQNRLLSSLKGYLSKLKAEIGKPNSVKTNFNYSGQVIVSKENMTEDLLMEKTLDLAIDEIIENEDCFEILVNPKDFYNVRDEMSKREINIIESEIKYIPTTYVNLDQENFEKLQRFLDSCEEDDDIQWVVTNFGEVE